MGRKIAKAVAYLRTSSAANVGQDKDSDTRQRVAIEAFASRASFELVAEYYDAAVSGADPIENREGFAALLDHIEGNGVRTVIVEDATRFARDLITQETGVIALQARGVTVLTASGDDLTASDDPFKIAMRQIAGAFAQLEKARLVGKLAAARKRKREATGKCEGRKSHAEARPDVVALVRQMRRKTKAGRMSLRAISADLATQGHLNERGKPFNPASVAAMLAR